VLSARPCRSSAWSCASRPFLAAAGVTRMGGNRASGFRRAAVFGRAIARDRARRERGRPNDGPKIRRSAPGGGNLDYWASAQPPIAGAVLSQVFEVGTPRAIGHEPNAPNLALLTWVTLRVRTSFSKPDLPNTDWIDIPRAPAGRGVPTPVTRYGLAKPDATMGAADGSAAGFAADLVRLDVDLILAFGGPATTAAKKATGKIPIVFLLVADPVAIGIATTMDRPGANATRATNHDPEQTGSSSGC
jgi:ABC transporter substrate binding protein